MTSGSSSSTSADVPVSPLLSLLATGSAVHLTGAVARVDSALHGQCPVARVARPLVTAPGFAAGQVGLSMMPPGGSLLYELVRQRRLRVGYVQELRGASLFAACGSRKK